MGASRITTEDTAIVPWPCSAGRYLTLPPKPPSGAFSFPIQPPRRENIPGCDRFAVDCFDASIKRPGNYLFTSIIFHQTRKRGRITIFGNYRRDIFLRSAIRHKNAVPPPIGKRGCASAKQSNLFVDDIDNLTGQRINQHDLIVHVEVFVLRQLRDVDIDGLRQR